MKPRAAALLMWINNELDYFDDLLNAAKGLTNRESQVVANVGKLIQTSLMEITNSGIAIEAAAPVSEKARLTEKDLYLVREMQEYARFRGQPFDVDYVSKCSKVIPSLRTGKWDEALTVAQPNDASANLALPIAQFVDYVSKHPTGGFKADLDRMCARLQSLQYLADSIQ
jgi:hypothetical protein